ncbi:MAG: serine acetyltransferase [bacterium]|nr:serine acetyltransferase [bacterium]
MSDNGLEHAKKGGGLFTHLRADIDRYREYGDCSPLPWLYFRNQGLWACFCYRAGRWLSDHRLWPGLRQLVMVFYHLWWKWTEVTTGISISPDCRIGPGLYIGHFGGIILHYNVVMGAKCNLSQGVTLGLACVDGKWGVPSVGDRVYIAPGAKIIGPIHLADGTVVGANAVVTRSTEVNATVVGIPAKEINRNGSGECIQV